MIRSAISLAVSEGTAKPTPMLPPDPSVRIDVFIPITRPWRSASAPPELPGLIGASVWIMATTDSRPSSVRLSRTRPLALTMPEVTVCCRPNGLPIATASCPTSTEISGANTATPNAKLVSILTTATSVSWSAPSTSPGTRTPDARVTCTSVNCPTTWAFVRINPLAS